MEDQTVLQVLMPNKSFDKSAASTSEENVTSGETEKNKVKRGRYELYTYSLHKAVI